MAKFQSPLLGYNNNVRHRGRTFHIQTEDSGVQHPHIITHLFMDGGRILKSVKKSYAEHVGADGMNDTVRLLMKEQHKAMVVALRDGEFDALVDPEGKRVPTPSAPQGPVKPVSSELAVAKPASTDSTEVAVNGAPIVTKTTVSTDVAATTPARMTPAAVIAAIAPLERRRDTPRTPSPSRHSSEVFSTPVRSDTDLPPEIEALMQEDPPAPAPAPASPAPSPAAPEPPTAPTAEVEAKPVEPFAEEEPKTTREPDKLRPSALELTLDFDALEQESLSAIYQRSDLPPPPLNLFSREARSGAYRTVDTEAQAGPTQRGRASSRPDAMPPQPQPRSTPPGVAKPDGRYASARPPPPARPTSPSARPPPVAAQAPEATTTSAAATAKRQDRGSSIFSDELVSDKSLDEVILSYLAEDLDKPSK